MSTKTAEETLDDYRKKNANRQSKHYSNNKDTINEKRRAVYRAGVEARKNATIVTEIRVPIPEVMSTTSQYGNKIVDFSKAKTINKEEVITALKSIADAPASLKTYKSGLETLIRITGCTDILECLKKPKDLVQKIKNAKQRNGNPYGVNSLKGLFQLVPFLITHLNLTALLPKKTIDIYKNEFDVSKLNSFDYTSDVIQNKQTYSFKIYNQKVLNEFGENSKMWLLTRFYEEFTLRDNFGLIVVNKLPPKPDKKNYLLVKPRGMQIFINDFKTKNKYKEFSETLSKSLENLTRQYIKDNNIQFGSYLFGTEKLTQFVSLSNKKMGIQGGVSEFRHMKISEILGDPNITNEEKLELANKMKHSPLIQLRYLRMNFVK